MARKKVTNLAVDHQYAASESNTLMAYGKHKADNYKLTLAQQAGAVQVADVSVSDAFELANLDWKAVRRAAYYEGVAGPEVVQDYISLVRDDTDEFLSYRSPSWTPAQPEDMMQVFQYLEDKAKITNILQINNGRKVFITAEINVQAEITAGDVIRRRLNMFNSFDGTTSLGVGFSTDRLFCANQLSYVVGQLMDGNGDNNQRITHRHTSNITEFMKTLPQLINAEQGTFMKETELFQHMTNVKVTKDMFEFVIEGTYKDKLERPIKDKTLEAGVRPRVITDLREYEQIEANFYGDNGIAIKGHDGVEGTMWGLFNSITQLETHGRQPITTPDKARSRLERLYGGASSKRIHQATRACMAAL